MPDNVKDKLVTLEALKLVNDINLPKDLSELDSVPNEVTVSSTDIIAMQVDGTTYKLPVSALASALKSTGNYITSSEVANDLTTSTAGKVLDARQGAAIKSIIDSLDLPDVSEAHENTSWKSAPIGMSHYYYDEVDASTTYGVPVDNCFVVVMRSDGSGSQSRGVALAFRWTRGSTATTSSNDIWMSTLQDEDSSTDVDWFAWVQISYDALPVSKGGTGSDTASGARSTLTEASVGGNWTQAPVGISYYSYETNASPTAYTIPFNFCDIYVFKRSELRGTAIAVRWNRANSSTNSKPETDIWMCALHGTWSDWKKISWAGAIPIEAGGTNAITASGALTNLGGVSKTGDTMTGILTVGTDAYFQKVASHIDVKANPSAIQYADVVVTRDKDNHILGLIGSTHRTDGTNTLRLVCNAFDTNGTATSSKGITIYNNRSGVASYGVDNRANFRDAIGIKYLNTSLNFTAYTSGSYANYDFGTSVYVLGASIVANRITRIVSFSRVSGFTTWTFQLNTTSAQNNVSVDITYIVIN